MRALQEKYFSQLQAMGAEMQGHIYPYYFYFSRVLDLDLSKQAIADQRSLRFDNYGGLTVVELTGNYFAAYAGDSIDKTHRALRTFQDVMMPLLQIGVPAIKDIPEAEGFAMEISHHVRGKAMGMGMERAENLVLVLPRDAAIRLVSAKTENDRQAALLDGQFFVNGEPFILYLSDQQAAQAAKNQPQMAQTTSSPKEPSSKPKSPNRVDPATAIRPFPKPAPVEEAPPTPPRDTSAEALAKTQASYQKIIDLVMKELDAQAHFVSYAPAAMIAFRKNAYLEFSVSTTLPSAAGGSRYKNAATAFDDHISHLIRPTMAYFKGDLEFDGIAYSTTIHPPEKDKAATTQADEAVEFFFPIAALRCYENYDCTGQQLIDQGSVLINGERVSLDLQTAEGSSR
jgi:hypothetical protein